MTLFLVSLLVCVPVCWLLASFRTRGGPSWLRMLAKISSVPLAVVVAGFLTLAVSSGFEEGAWQCLRCGRIVERTQWVGITLSESQEPWQYGRIEYDSRPFTRWYDSAFPAHEHDWQVIGCHYRGNGVGCAFYPYAQYFLELASLRDRELAGEIVHRVDRAEHEVRRRLILSYAGFAHERSNGVGVRPPPAERQAWSAWIAAHPEWQ